MPNLVSFFLRFLLRLPYISLPPTLSPGWIFKPTFNPVLSSCSHLSLAVALATRSCPSLVSAVQMTLTSS